MAAKKEKNLSNRSGVWYWTQVIAGKRYSESLQTGDLRTAKERMKVKQKAAEAEDWGALYGTRSKSAFPTVGELCEMYLAEVKRRGRPAEGTAKRNVSNLERLMTVAGVSDPSAACMSVLSVELLKKYADAVLAANNSPSSKRSIDSLIRQARSVFSRRMDYLHDVIQPKGFERFLTAKIITPDRVDNALPPADVMVRLIEAGRKLRERENKQLYLAFILCYDLGLRNEEAEESKKSWFDRDQKGIYWLHIKQRESEGYKPKTSREIPVPKKIMDDLLKFGGEEHILAGTMTARHNLLKRELSRWMREFIPTGSKSVYVLRRMRGSFWRLKYGLDRAHDWLGHSSYQVTLRHYAKIPKIDEPQPVDADLAALRMFG
jgi:integrase